ALHAFSFPPGTHVRRKNVVCHAAEIRRTCRTQGQIARGLLSRGLTRIDAIGRSMAQQETAGAGATPRIGKPADPCVMVIFGAAGDLTQRKLIPALYNLAKYQLLSREFAVIGVARNPMTTEEFRKRIGEDLQKFATSQLEPDLTEWFLRRMYYITGEFSDQSTFDELKATLKKADEDHGTHGNYFYYLATAPDFFGPIVEKLSSTGLMTEENHQWRRVIIEKPFGRDIDSARSLNQQLLKVVSEKQIYRIDHYLGKETV